MRLFFSILCNEVAAYLAALPIGIRPVKDFHITLKFLGESFPRQVVSAAQGIIFRPFELTLSCIGAFPSMSRPRIVWAGVEPKEPVVALQRLLDERLLDAGFKPDNKFLPHITVARNQRMRKITVPKLIPKKIYVGSFFLMHSKLTPLGPVYRQLREFSADKD